MSTTKVHVTSHVSRDLLQSAGMFRNERLVVWEYVSNSLDYVDPGTSPIVRVRMDAKKHRIIFEDNGRGMDLAGLSNFFRMHGENVDRKSGRGGRGRFGTGKSAAFGIGDVLRITTVHNGKRSKVELTRTDLAAASSGDPVPVKTLEEEVSTQQPNGTLVEIEDIHLRAFDQAAVTAYIERHLAHWPKDVTVIVNNHQCEYTEPPIERTETFKPDAEAAKFLGDVTLTIKVSKSPLPDDLRGISVFSKGVWHETTLLSIRGKEMSEYLFGELDVPALDTDKSTPPAFDASRSLKLNPANPLVTTIYSFVGPKLEEVRKELIAAQREEKASDEAKRLRQEASKIEDIINADFEAFRKRLQKVKAAAAATGGLDAGDAISGGGPAAPEVAEDFLFGGDVPAVVVEEQGEVGQNGRNDGGEGGPPRRLNPIVVPVEDGQEPDSSGHYEAKKDEKKRRRGGFAIEFDHQGEASGRAVYHRDDRTIFINLDHPQIAAAAKAHGTEDPVFRRLAYEVAFSEYAIALAMELDLREEFYDPQEAIVEVRETIHRIARAAAALYEG